MILEMSEQEKVAEMWQRIPFEQKFEIDIAIGQANMKFLRINRCMCAVKGFNLLTATKVVEKRIVELKRREIPRPSSCK